MKRLIYNSASVLVASAPLSAMAVGRACETMGNCVSAACWALSIASCFGGWIVSW